MEEPLHNRNIIVTRSWKQAAGLIARLKVLGANPVLFPTIQIQEPEDWGGCDEAIDQLSFFDWVIFSSFNGVHYFLNRLQQRGVDAIDAKIAAVGRTTADAIRSSGYKVDLIPEQFSAKGILHSLEKFTIKGKRFLLPTSNIGREELQNGLCARGALVTKVEAYRTVANRDVDTESVRNRIKKGEIDCIAFFSPSAFNFFVDIMGRSILEDLGADSIRIAAVGPLTAGAVRAEKLAVDIQPAISREEELVLALVDYYS